MEIEIREDYNFGYFIYVKEDNSAHWKCTRYCLTLFGAKRVVNRIMKQLDRGLKKWHYQA